MQYASRWCRLYTQASEQSRNTDVINRQLIVDHTSIVTVLWGKQSDNVLMCQTRQCVYKERLSDLHCANYCIVVMHA